MDSAVATVVSPVVTAESAFLFLVAYGDMEAQMQTQGVQTQDVVMPSQDVIEVWDPVPKEWGPSDLEAEKRITRSAQQHSREMRQYSILFLKG